MVIRLLTKVGVSGGALFGSIFTVESSIVNNKEIRETQEEGNFKITAEQINTLVDVDIFAKQNKCTFAFVNAWGTNEVNKAEEFIAKAGTQDSHRSKEKHDWTRLITEAVKREKDKCKDNKFLVFFSPKSNQQDLELRAP